MIKIVKLDTIIQFCFNLWLKAMIKMKKMKLKSARSLEQLFIKTKMIHYNNKEIILFGRCNKISIYYRYSLIIIFYHQTKKLKNRICQPPNIMFLIFPYINIISLIVARPQFPYIHKHTFSLHTHTFIHTCKIMFDDNIS